MSFKSTIRLILNRMYCPFINIINNVISSYHGLSLPAKAAIWYTFCNFFNKAVALLSTPIFTRIMSTEQYGAFAVFQSWFSILSIFTSLNIFLSCYTKGLIKYKDDKDNLTSSLFSLTTFITILFMIIYGMNIGFWTNFFNLHPILMAAMFIELITYPAYNFWITRKRLDNKYRSVVLYSILMNIICISTSAIAVIFSTNKLEARIFSDVGVKVLFALPIVIAIIYKGKKIINTKYWKYALSFNLPLIPHFLSHFVLNQSDRIMIGKMVGDSQAGFYSVSYTIATILNLLVTAINDSLMPSIFKALDSNNMKRIIKIKQIITPLSIVIAILCVLLTLFAPEIITVFAGNQYLDAIYIIPPVAASVYFYYIYSLFSHIEYYHQQTKKIAFASIISAALNIILNYVAISLFGYIAAGYTTLACYILLAIMHYLFYKKLIQKHYNNNDIYNNRLLFTIGVFLSILSIIILPIYNITILRYILIVITIIVILVFRNKFIKTLKLLQEK